MSNSYKLGTSVRIEGAFVDEDGVGFDPTTVTARVKTPDGTKTAYVYGVDAVVERAEAGVYFMWIHTALVDDSGTYSYRFEGETDSSPLPIDVGNESEFEVEESAFAEP